MKLVQVIRTNPFSLFLLGLAELLERHDVELHKCEWDKGQVEIRNSKGDVAILSELDRVDSAAVAELIVKLAKLDYISEEVING